MMKRPATLFSLLVAFCVGSASLTRAESLPAPPGFVPTARATTSPTIPPTTADEVVQKFTLYRGWNAVAFPFAKVAGISGFPFGLYDSYGEPLSFSSVTPGMACWAYSEAEGEAAAWGQPLHQPVTLSLASGWNLIGSPYTDGINASRSVLSQAHNVGQRTLSESVGPWLQSEAFEIQGVKPMGFDLTKPEVRLKPGRAYMVQASTSVQMQVAPADNLPQVSEVQLGAPGELIVSGSRFGPPGLGRLLLDGQGIPANDVIAWSPNQIRVRWSGNAQPRVAQVLAAPAAGPELAPPQADKLAAPTRAAAPFRIELRVVNEAQEPVPNARIEVNHQLVARTDSSGWARWNAGSASAVYARVIGDWYQAKDIRLTSSGARSYNGYTTVYSDRSTIDLKLLCCSGNYRPVKVDVWRKNDPSQHQLLTWTWDKAHPFVTFFYPDVPVGLTYHFEFTWRDNQGMEKLLTFDKRLRPQGIRETIPNYWNTNPWSY